MERLLDYNSQTDSFEELIYPQNITGWEYEVRFSTGNINPKNDSIEVRHYIYCRNFNDLTVVLGKLSPILNKDEARTDYYYVGEEQTHEYGTQHG